MQKRHLAAFAAAPLLALPVACGSPAPTHCDPHVINNGLAHSASVGFNCHGAVVSITGVLSRTPGSRSTGSRWTGVAGGNGAAFNLYLGCAWDFSRPHSQDVSASAYQGTRLVGYYTSSTPVGGCG